MTKPQDKNNTDYRINKPLDYNIDYDIDNSYPVYKEGLEITKIKLVN